MSRAQAKTLWVLVGGLMAATPPVVAEPQACQLLRAGLNGDRQALLQFARRLHDEDPDTLLARAELARLGGQGFSKRPDYALALERQAAASSGRAAFHVALTVVAQHLRQGTPTPAAYDEEGLTPLGRELAELLRPLSLWDPKERHVDALARGAVHTLLGELHERGLLTGRREPERAGEHYQVAAQAQYLPGVAARVAWLVKSWTGLHPQAQDAVRHEIRILCNRYQWASPRLLRTRALAIRQGILNEAAREADFYEQAAALVAKMQEAGRQLTTAEIPDGPFAQRLRLELTQRSIPVTTVDRLNYLTICSDARR